MGVEEAGDELFVPSGSGDQAGSPEIFVSLKKLDEGMFSNPMLVIYNPQHGLPQVIGSPSPRGLPAGDKFEGQEMAVRVEPKLNYPVHDNGVFPRRGDIHLIGG